MIKEIQSFYMLKAFCAFCVVCLHVLFWGRSAIVPIIYIAVPCFYLISGYFLVDQAGFVIEKQAKKQLLKLIKLTISVNFLYFIIKLSLGHTSLLDLTDFHCWIKWILWGRLFSGHLWFLNAYIEVLIFAIVIIRINGYCAINNVILFLTSSLLFFSLLLGRYSFLLDRSFGFDVYCNVFTLAIPFVVIGAYFRSNEKELCSFLSKGQYIFILVIVLFLAYIEFGLQFLFPSLKSGGSLNITTIPLAIVIFWGCLICKDYETNSVLLVIGKQYSTDIYLYHMAFVSLLWHYHDFFMKSNFLITPFLIYLFCIGLSLVLHKTNSFLIHIREKRCIIKNK